VLSSDLGLVIGWGGGFMAMFMRVLEICLGFRSGFPGLLGSGVLEEAGELGRGDLLRIVWTTVG
jgi:hypothetical protein